MSGDLKEGAETAVKQCLNVQSDEEVLIVADDERMEIAQSIREVSLEEAGETMLLNIEKTDQHGAEPPRPVTSAMKDSDVVIAPTTYSLSHTQARIAACNNGVRMATLPGITKEIFTTSMLADYEDIKKRSEKIYKLLSGVDEVHVKSPSGTDISLEIDMDRWDTDTGILHNPGDFGNLPAGETDGSPLNAEGKIVIDSLELHGKEIAPPGTEVKIRDTKAVDISEECRLKKVFERVENARTLAELGIGTNPKATIIGNILQDEKVMGTCHFAFGDNTSYGGASKSEIHWDSVIKSPTIKFDDRKIMERGDFLV
ncbi:MAG: aminopeptidase [Candidatus Nanohaloarchaea archaeon]|nr:aminopeptidase [Candidatus Nanohaloarchaea archaeon]